MTSLYQELLAEHRKLLKDYKDALIRLAERPEYLTEPIPLMERYEGDDRPTRTAPMIGADPFRDIAAELAEEARLLESAVGNGSRIELH